MTITTIQPTTITTPTTTTTTTIITISDIGPFDVLCGRCKECFNNIGNRRFRVLINLNLNRYVACKKQSKALNEVVTFIYSLTEELCESIRFFKRTKNDDGTTGTTLSLMDHIQSRDKISHALRDAAASQQTKIKNKSKSKIRSNDKTTMLMEASMSKKRQETSSLPQLMSITNNYKNTHDKHNNNNNNNPSTIITTPPLPLRRLSTYVFQEEIDDYEVELRSSSDNDCIPLTCLSDTFNNDNMNDNYDDDDDENTNHNDNYYNNYDNQHQQQSNQPHFFSKERRTSCSSFLHLEQNNDFHNKTQLRSNSFETGFAIC